MPLTLDRSGSLRRRKRIAKLKEKGLTLTEIAEKLGIAVGTVSYYLATEAPVKGVRGTRPYHRRVAPIVLGSEVNGSGNSSTINDTSLLDLLWARLTVEEKATAIGAIKGLEVDNG